MQMPFTGERFVPELRGQIYYEHLHRYVLAARLAHGADVLDIASGEGYGAAFLAGHARSIVGVDVDPQTVRHAASRYTAENLSFRVGSCTQIPLPDRSVDLVVSFETIEHIEEHEQFMREIVRVLRPGGRLVMSSPNRLVYSDLQSYQNPYHVKELYFDEFRDLIKNWFPRYRIFGQRIFAASAVHPLLGSAAATRCMTPLTRDGDDGLPAFAAPAYFIAACSLAESDAELDGFASIFVDPQDDLLEHILHPVPLLAEQHALPPAAPPALEAESLPALAAPDAQPADAIGTQERALLDDLLHTIYGDERELPPLAEALPFARQRVVQAHASFEELMVTLQQERYGTEEAMHALQRAEERTAHDAEFLHELVMAVTHLAPVVDQDGALDELRQTALADVRRLVHEREQAAELLSLALGTLVDERHLSPEHFEEAKKRIREDALVVREAARIGEELAVERERVRSAERNAAAVELARQSLDVRVEELRAEVAAQTARAAAESARADAESARADDLARAFAQTNAALDDVVHSRSWQLTKPVRVMMGAVRGRSPKP